MNYFVLFLIGFAIGIIGGLIVRIIVNWIRESRATRNLRKNQDVLSAIFKEQMKTAKTIHLDEIEEFFGSWVKSKWVAGKFSAILFSR